MYEGGEKMKLQLDTTKKTIKIDEDVKLSKLITTLKNMFPNGEWKDFTLEKNAVIEHWNNPIIYREYCKEVEPIKPWYQQPYITCCGSTNSVDKNNYQLTSGVFNIEV